MKDTSSRAQVNGNNMVRAEPTPDIEAGIAAVRTLIEGSIRSTSLRSVVDRFKADVTAGKMLRARLILSVGPAAGVPDAILHNVGAAVEMLQSASLLHDDVLDGGIQRRGKPSFWVSEGTKAAVLVGDLLVSGAVGYVLEALPGAMHVLVTTMREMCDAEAEQEFHLGPEDGSWDHCVSIARRKTGSLFGFAARCAGGRNEELSSALLRAGYALGTAYQLADDLVDACPDAEFAGKTLGTDALTEKVTAATSWRTSGQDPLAYIDRLLRASEAELAAWPAVRDAWERYVRRVVAPVIERFARSACPEAAL